MSKHVIILGCGRSGTSIFGELFEHISDYQYYSEPSFEDVINLNYLTPIAIKVPKESIDYRPTPGLSFPLTTMLSILPKNRQFYWQVRHPLDAIASLRPGISNNWRHHPRPPDWQEWSDRTLVEKCAHHWAYINTVGFASVSHLVEICEFEIMLEDPYLFVEKRCAELEISKDKYSIDLTAWSERVQNTNNEKFIEAKTSRNLSRPDHKQRIGRWKENLNQEDLKQVIPIVYDAANKFGYVLPSGFV